MSEYKDPVLYVPGRPGIIALMRAGKDGVLRTTIDGNTIEEMQKDYPGCVLGELDKVAADSEEMHKSPPVPITKEQYIKALEVLPPNDWVSKGGCESFKMSEHYSGNITGIYARCGTKYYYMLDRASMTHNQIIAAILNPKE